MNKILVLLFICGTAFLLIGASNTERPSLASCGTHLPPGSQYSVELEASWDRRPDSMGNNILITLRNDETGKPPEALSDELESFAECARMAVGL
jgi:hypothetical protein